VNKMRTALFWVVTRRVVVIYYRRFGTNYRSPFTGSKNPKRKSVAQIFCIGAPDGRVRAVVSLSSIVSGIAYSVRTQTSVFLVCDGYFEVELEKLLGGWGCSESCPTM